MHSKIGLETNALGLKPRLHSPRPLGWDLWVKLVKNLVHTTLIRQGKAPLSFHLEKGLPPRMTRVLGLRGKCFDLLFAEHFRIAERVFLAEQGLILRFVKVLETRIRVAIANKIGKHSTLVNV